MFSNYSKIIKPFKSLPPRWGIYHHQALSSYHFLTGESSAGSNSIIKPLMFLTDGNAYRGSTPLLYLDICAVFIFVYIYIERVIYLNVYTHKLKLMTLRKKSSPELLKLTEEHGDGCLTRWHFVSKQRLHSSVTTLSAAPKGRRRRLTTQPCHHQSTALSTKLCQEKTGAGGGVRERAAVTARDEGENKTSREKQSLRRRVKIWRIL